MNDRENKKNIKRNKKYVDDRVAYINSQGPKVFTYWYNFSHPSSEVSLKISEETAMRVLEPLGLLAEHSALTVSVGDDSSRTKVESSLLQNMVSPEQLKLSRPAWENHYAVLAKMTESTRNVADKIQSAVNVMWDVFFCREAINSGNMEEALKAFGRVILGGYALEKREVAGNKGPVQPSVLNQLFSKYKIVNFDQLVRLLSNLEANEGERAKSPFWSLSITNRGGPVDDCVLIYQDWDDPTPKKIIFKISDKR